MNNKNLSSILLFLSFQLSAMEQPEQQFFSKLELLPSDLKLKVLKDVIGQSATAAQAIKSTRTFIFNDRKLCLEMDTAKLCCIIQLLAHGWFFCDVSDVVFNQLIPKNPQSKAAQNILANVKKLTYFDLGDRKHPLLVKSAETFEQFLALAKANKKIPAHILADLDLDYYHPCNEPVVEFCQVTPLIAAVHLHATTAAEQLIAARCNLEKKDTKDYTALHLACRLGHNKIIKALIDAGADVNARGTCNNTPLIVLSISGGFNSCIKKMLIETGADPSLTDIFMHTAAYYNDRKIGQVPISSRKKSFRLHP